MPRMKAVQIHRFGAEEVMQLDEVEIPSPEARQMVIKIAATSINHSDLHPAKRKHPYWRAGSAAHPRPRARWNRSRGRPECY